MKLPEICAPLRPSIPSGFSKKLMIGRVTTWLSRTTPKCCEYCSAPAALVPAPAAAVAAPRCAILRVISWNADWPLSVKSKVTLGWFVTGSKFCLGLVMSVPESAGRSSSTILRGVGLLLEGLGDGRVVGLRLDHHGALWHREDHQFLGSFWFLRPSVRSCFDSAGEVRSWCESLSKR